MCGPKQRKVRFEKINRLITDRRINYEICKDVAKTSRTESSTGESFVRVLKLCGKIFSKNHLQHDFSLIYETLTCKGQCARNIFRRLKNS